jgi:hypothetical protein
MTDIIPQIQSRVAGLDDRINRLRAEIESAEAERSDLQIALRVYSDLTGAKPAPSKAVEPVGSTAAQASSRPSAEKKQLILALLGTSEAVGRAPATVFQQLIAQNVKDIPITQVRTILWRMESKKQGVESKDGRYWRTVSVAHQPSFPMEEG